MCPIGARLSIADVPEGRWSTPGEMEGARWRAWVDAPPWFGGVLPLETGGRLDLEIEICEAGLALLRVSGRSCSSETVARRLAEAGMPVVGDLVHGGLARPGGLCLVSQDSADGEEPLADPFDAEAPPWPIADGPGDDATDALTLRVSKQAARALRRGHPWLLPDDASDRSDRFQPGTLLRVEDREAHVLGWAWSEGSGEISARMAATGHIERRGVASIEARVAKALARRASLLAAPSGVPATDCFRLIHGEADGLPGFFVDRIGPLLRVLVTSRVCEGFRGRALGALEVQLPVSPEGIPFSVIELVHLRSTGGRAEFERVRWRSGGVEALQEIPGLDFFGSGFFAQERGLRFAVDPGWDSPRRTRPGFGLFPDQRINRERLAAHARDGGRWLNLFAHTGAFSVSLLAAGASSVESVDLSAPYLERLEANLLANTDRGVDPARHRSRQSESRRMLEELAPGQRFDGIVLDPPTAAAAGRRFWSVKQDLEPLIRLCVDRLESGGVLLVTQNRKGPALGLEHLLERVAARAHRAVGEIAAAPPGPDFPDLEGFPEGSAFEGARLVLS